MTGDADTTSAGESAGSLLQSYWESVEFDTPEGLADSAVEIRARYARLPESDDITNAVGTPAASSCSR